MQAPYNGLSFFRGITMKTYRLYQKQFLPIDLAEAWAFFSNPRNLRLITPDRLDFVITSPSGEKMYPGQIITYTLRPLFGIKAGWVTEIKHVHEPYTFVDEQRSGPYKLWHHRHVLREVPGGIEAEDEVYYALPYGFLGQLAHALFVQRELARIFAYRKSVLDRKFGPLKAA